MTKTKNVLLSALMLMVAVLLIACGNSNQSKDGYNHSDDHP